MLYEDFIQRFERVVAGGMGSADSERAIAATLGTLVECVPAQAARDLAEQLPQRLKPQLAPAGEPAQTLTLSEFLERAAEREGVSPSEAYDHARAVLETLAEAVTGRELAAVRTQLPDQLAPLFEPPAAAGWPDERRHRPHP